MSGVEAAVIKGSSAAGVKAVGWASGKVKDYLTDRRTLAALAESSPSTQVLDEILAKVDGTLAEDVVAFVSSPEYEQTLLGLATERGLRLCEGKKSEKRLAQIRTEFSENLRLVMSGRSEATRESLETALYQMADESVTVAVRELLGSDGSVHPRVRARLIKCASDVAAASVRNSELLREMDDFAVMRKFEDELRAAIRSLHGNMRLPHAGTTRQVAYDRLFVSPSVRQLGDEDAAPQEGEVDADSFDEEEPLSLADFVAMSQRTILLGNPGGGKSTSSLKLVYDVAADKLPFVPATVPFLVILRDYADQFEKTRLSILDFLDSRCRTPYGVTPPEHSIESLLLNGRGLVVFDGLDELLDTSRRREVVEVVEGFAHRYPLTPILVTSRLVGYEDAPLDPDLFGSVELRNFSKEQVEAYTRKWFSLDDSTPADRQQSIANSFLEESRFVGDLRVNPLMLSLMCGIYSTEHYIPRNRPDVYEKCALLLFDRWDKQRGIEADLAFDAHVKAAMRSLALWLYPRQEAQVGLPRQDLVNYMRQYLLDKRFDDEIEAEEAANQFIDFCKGRAWVLTDMGSELYGFTHRTFLEYFAASQLVRTHHSPDRLLDALWDRVRASEWTVVSQLAVQILGKDVEDGADDFLDLLVARSDAVESPFERATLLSFACRTLEFVVPRPTVLRALVERALGLNASSVAADGTADDELTVPLGNLIDATPENFALISKYLREQLKDRLSDSIEEASMAFVLKPVSFTRRHSTLGRRVSTTEVWNSWAIENWAAFRDEIHQHAQVLAWVASEQCRRGIITARPMVERFGVRSFFDYHTAGRVVDPPIAYSAASFVTSNRKGFLSPVLATEILELLMEADVPWISRRDDYDQLIVHGIGIARSDAKASQLAERIRQQDGEGIVSVALLFALAVWEYRQKDRASSPHGRLSFVKGYLGIAGRANVRRAIDERAKELSIDAKVQKFVEAWIAGNVQLVAAE